MSKSRFFHITARHPNQRAREQFLSVRALHLNSGRSRGAERLGNEKRDAAGTHSEGYSRSPRPACYVTPGLQPFPFLNHHISMLTQTLQKSDMT